MPTEQSFESHLRIVPIYHYFVLPVFLINTIWRLAELRHGIFFSSILDVLVAAALMSVALFARTFALTVQDRVIRLEMEMRFEKLLPADLRARIFEFTQSQLIALRFTGDGELPTLARQVLDEKLTNRKTIKSRIKNWRADFLRA